MHVIPVFRRLREKDNKFKTNVRYIARSCLKTGSHIHTHTHTHTHTHIYKYTLSHSGVP
jgi:hypothetical protein